MGLIIGAGASRPVSPNQLLGIGLFSESKNYNAGEYCLNGNKFYQFKVNHPAGAWNASHVKEISTLDLILASLGDPRIKPFSVGTVKEGDMLFYDRARQEYCYVPKAMIGAVLADYNSTRYETNGDTYIGTQGGKAHFVARQDAMPSQEIYSNTVAATSCFYRLEITVGQAGSITFSAASGNASIAETTITWTNSNSLTEIVALFTAKNTSYITFAKLADDKGVGLEIGGYGANTLTVTDTTNCTVIDCSKYAFYRSQNPAAPAVGGTFNPNAGWTLLGDAHHNFRGAAAASILTGKDLVAANSTCYGNDGFDYSYRTGVNFAKFKSWASTNGSSSWIDDGEGGTQGTHAAVMTKAEFEADVQNYSGSDAEHLAMKNYYAHLFSDQTGDYATLRQSYEAKYGQMTCQYDGYLMSHCMDVSSNSGITNAMRNKGKNQTEVKADCMNVNYNYVIIPAYPPEYNAHTYGVSDSEGFAPNTYYHPEPGDIGLFLRDDIMTLVNANITTYGSGTALDNSTYMGSSADFSADISWYFNGDIGCFNLSYRYSSYFRSRPVLALSLS